jgi:osmotically-inducible protein OsmY
VQFQPRTENDRDPTVLPGDVRESIGNALQRHAEREANRITVAVRDGTVSLSGAVHSWSERQAVVGAATGTPGVRRVDTQLRIEPYVN